MEAPGGGPGWRLRVEAAAGSGEGARLAGCSPTQSTRLPVSPRVSRPSVALWVPQELAPQGAEWGGGQVGGSEAFLSRAGRAGRSGAGGRGSELGALGPGLWARGGCEPGVTLNREPPQQGLGASGAPVRPQGTKSHPPPVRWDLSRRPPPLDRCAVTSRGKARQRLYGPGAPYGARTEPAAGTAPRAPRWLPPGGLRGWSSHWPWWPRGSRPSRHGARALP